MRVKDLNRFSEGINIASLAISYPVFILKDGVGAPLHSYIFVIFGSDLRLPGNLIFRLVAGVVFLLKTSRTIKFSKCKKNTL
jgi:hypothetical protein